MSALSREDAEARIAASRRLYVKLVRSVGVPAADVDDVVQDATVRLLRVWPKWNPARGSFDTFAGNVVERTARWWLARRAKRPAAVPLDERYMRPAHRSAPGGSPAPLTGPAAAMLAALPPKHERLVRLLLVDGVSLDQAADQIGCKPYQARITLGHALAKLAAAGHVPPDLAARFGFDAGEMAAKGDHRASRAAVPARRARVSELLSAARTPRQIAAKLATPLPTIRDDIRHLTRPRTPTAGQARTAARTAARAAKRANRLRHLDEVVRPRRARLAALLGNGTSLSAAARQLGLPEGTAESDRRAIRQAARTSG